MKAAVHHSYGPPEDVITVEDVPDVTPGADEVLVRVHAAGVNWADRSMTLGMPYVMRLGYGLRRPRKGIRGTDLAGSVEAVGEKVTEWKPGDYVFGWSTATFAEYATVAADHLVEMPASITFDQAAGIPLAGCVALQAMRDIARVSPGDEVLVVGASGGIGTFTVAVAKAMGATVTGVCSTPNVDLVAAVGADTIIDYTKVDFTATDKRYDVILDMADRHSLAERRRILARDGILIPNSGEGGPRFGSIGRILKAWAMSPFVSQKLRPFLSMSKQADLQVLVEMIEDGTLNPIVGNTYSLTDTGAAISEAGSGHARGKVIIKIKASE